MINQELNIQKWLAICFPEQPVERLKITGDASFRQYERIKCQGHHYILLIDHNRSDLEKFLKIAKCLINNHFHVPEILHQNLSLGLVILSDLGSVHYLDTLTSDNKEKLYKDAFQVISKFKYIKSTDVKGSLPTFNKFFIYEQLQLFKTWYLEKYLGLMLDQKSLEKIDEVFHELINNLDSLPSVFTHMDFHSRNLMVTENNNPGILDFQDAMYAPYVYDLVSLLKDCYIKWDRKEILYLLEIFYKDYLFTEKNKPLTFEKMVEHFDLVGAQRHLKVLGVFSRLHFRDNKSTYLNDIPRVKDYLLEVCELYPQLSNLIPFLQSNRISK
ncbi:MAG: aminoglycoside phosphotransferase [Francisellaceae bacterium]|nr:aminoglycoside phosphotransferase [Francisellaceae bacterium]